jgi:ADP-ribosylglycohydrolase
VIIPPDYEERVYAGVLGKLTGVYLGRPIEGWTYERISQEIGEVTGYLPGRGGAPLIVTDDDITGTFTFVRALADNGYPRDLTPQQVGEAWLNYTIERRTIFWWGGLGNSTEHTAYLRLKHGIPAPQSGSIACNGKTVAEQIGAQIFIDGWAMVAPGDPEFAADLARRAASVSHDGEAIYGAQVIAAMESMAFVESDIQKLIDAGLRVIPNDSIIARLIHDIREWHAADRDWRRTRERIADIYGYHRYRGNCHMVPNHALIILALLYGEDDFRRSLMIVNTSGWDTDCNSGNVGCLLGIKNGLRAFEGTYDWRGPVADRLYLSTADGGRAITDALTEAYHLINTGRRLAGLEPMAPKGGARFHFSLPGSVQGFQAESGAVAPARLENVAGHSHEGTRSLAITVTPQAGQEATRVWTSTFIPPEALTMPGYQLLASPTLYPGQTVRARVEADAANPAPARVRLVARHYDSNDQVAVIGGDAVAIASGAAAELVWRVPDTGGCPIFGVGLEITPEAASTLYLDWLTWDGTPQVVLGRPSGSGQIWRRAWVDGVDQFEGRWPEPYRIVQNEGTGLISQGGPDWTDYRVEAPITIWLAKSGGLAARVQGLRRYYALLLAQDKRARLVKMCNQPKTLAETAFPVEWDRPYHLALEVTGERIRAWIDGQPVFDVVDREQPLTGGGIGLVVEEGCLSSDAVTVVSHQPSGVSRS